jgi:hypothetical protein
MNLQNLPSMSIVGKSLAFTLVLAIAISSLTLLTIKPVNAQPISKPSVPDFTVQYFDNVVNVAPTTSTNPYTGQNVTEGKVSYHNATIVFTIKNQPFTPYTNSNGSFIGLYYNFRYKGHYEDKWTYFPFTPYGITSTPWNGMLVASGSLPYFPQSVTANTTFTLGIGTFVGPDIPYGGQLDFGVQAQIGYIAVAGGGSPSLGTYYNFTGESSDWSITRTITIPATANSTPTPTVPEFPWLTTLLLLAVVAISLLVAVRQQAKKP